MSSYMPLQEKAYAYLKKQITGGKLEPNVVYSETKIAAEIGVSRTPMKDALVRLRQGKYVDILPSRGVCLHVLREEDIRSAFQVRMAIEGFCALNTPGRDRPPSGSLRPPSGTWSGPLRQAAAMRKF